MKTIRRLLYAGIIQSVMFVATAFLALFLFIDFVEELSNVGAGYTTLDALWHSTMLLPGHLYELLPIAVLIGTIYALSRMAQSSEFTILRTSGLSPRRALTLLGILGVVFAVLTWLIGDWVSPAIQRQATLFKAGFSGGLSSGRAGLWLKDRQVHSDGSASFYSINVKQVVTDGSLRQVRIFELDGNGRLVGQINAEQAVVEDHRWLLKDATVMTLKSLSSTSAASATSMSAEEAQWSSEKFSSVPWSTSLQKNVVAAAALPEETMTTKGLFTYMQHLKAQNQDAQRYEFAFWQRALYPFACVVMMALALPFAYLQTRRGGLSTKVFGGIMLGISFVLMNTVSSNIAQLQQWTPWIAAITPSLIYLLIAMGSFTWLVRYR